MGVRRWETGDMTREGRRKKIDKDGRGFSYVISEKFSAYNLAGKLKNVITLIENINLR